MGVLVAPHPPTLFPMALLLQPGDEERDAGAERGACIVPRDQSEHSWTVRKGTSRAPVWQGASPSPSTNSPGVVVLGVSS